MLSSRKLRASDAILLGAIGDPCVPPGVLERGVLLPLRFVMDHHVNLRPVKLYPGVEGHLRVESRSTSSCREGTEGPYVGAGGVLRRDSQEVATEESLNTAFGVERIVRDAFDRATKRRKHVTLVHKTNVLTNADPCGSGPSIALRQNSMTWPRITSVDAAAMFFITDPDRFDVVVTDNLFGDILTDIGLPSVEESGWRPAETSIRLDRTRRCLSQCTVRLPTSQGRARPIRRRPSCPWRCCSTMSGRARRPRGWRLRWLLT